MSERARSAEGIRAPPGVDVAELAAELSRRQAGRQPVAPPPPRPPPFLGAEADPLERARALVERPGVEYEIGWRTPLLGQAWAALRETIHGEARLYVDALMARQSELDAALLAAVAQLRAEVADLRRAVGREEGDAAGAPRRQPTRRARPEQGRVDGVVAGDEAAGPVGDG